MALCLSFFKYCTYVLLAVLGLRHCMWTFSGHSEWGWSPVAGFGLLIVVASLVAEHELQEHRLQ